MRSSRSKSSAFAPAFTLVELVLVLAIIAIAAALIAPNLRGFGVSRQTNNMATQIVALARYARGQAVAEGRTYRLNFDPNSRTFWLTMDTGVGVFQSPTGDAGKKFTAPDGMNMNVQVNPQPNVLLNLPATAQQESSPANAQLIDGEQIGPAGVLMQNERTDGEYIEFQPTGRTDPADIRLTDRLGKSVEISCVTASELLHVVTPQEQSR